MKDEQQVRAPSSLLPTLMGRLGLPATQGIAEPTALYVRINTLQKQTSLEMLLQALDDTDESVRATAVRALERWGEQAPRKRIVACLHDDSWLVREAAVVTLNALGEPLETALLRTDESPYVRETTHLYIQQDDENDGIIFTNLDDESVLSTIRQRTHKNSRFFLPVAEGVMVALILFGLVGAWFTLAQYKLPKPIGQRQDAFPIASRVLLSQHFQNPIATPAWSADGKYIITVDSTNQVYVWNVTTKILSKTFVLPFKPSDIGGTWEWSFAPDGRYLVIASKQGEIEVWNTITGHMMLKNTTHAGIWPTWEWSTDDSSRIIIGNFNGTGTASIWYANSGERSVTLSDQSLKNIRYFTWSPDGHYIALFTAASSPTQPVINGRVQIWDASTGKEVQHFADGGDTGTILWSPDSTRILTASNKLSKNTTVRVWDALTGHKLLTYSGHSAVPQPFQWVNDSNVVSISNGLLEVVTQDNTLQIWNADTGRMLYTYKHATDGENGVSEAWSPDGKYVGFATVPSHVQMLDSATGVVHSVHSVYDKNAFFGSVQNLVWSPDGSMMLISNDRMIQILQLSN